MEIHPTNDEAQQMAEPGVLFIKPLTFMDSCAAEKRKNMLDVNSYQLCRATITLRTTQKHVWRFRSWTKDTITNTEGRNRKEI